MHAYSQFYPLNGLTQTVAYTGTAGVATNAFGTQTTTIYVVSTTACFIKFGTAPTATTADMYLPANFPFVLQCRGGEKVSAIQVAAGGSLYVTEMSR